MNQPVQSRYRQDTLWIFLFALWFVVPNPASAQRNFKPDARRPFRENVNLPIDNNLLKRFGTAEDLLADQRWAEAIAILQEIAQTESKGLVQIRPGIAGSVATYLNVATRCNILMSRVSSAGLKEYRQKFDPLAKRWFENWQRTRDDNDLLRIVRQAFLSNHGDDALLALGEAAWDRGDFSAARLWWNHLIPLPDDAIAVDYPTVLRFPDSSVDQATVLARMVMCSVLERDQVRAEEELRQFSERFPLAEGWLAGKTGRLADILQRILEESRLWPTVKHSAEVETFGLSPARFRPIPESLDVGALRWIRPLTPNLLPHPIEGVPFQQEPLSFHPVVYDKIVLLNDADSIRAFNVLTGEPAWQSDRKDPSVVYPTVPDEISSIPERMCVGVPNYTMTIAEGRLYARMGSPVTCTSNQQRDLASDLVCLDLLQEGKLVWKLVARELFRDDSWRFEGTPVIVAGRLYVTVSRRRPQLELMVMCLDAVDGRLVWQRPIGGFRVSVDDSHNRVSHLLLTSGAGRIFLSSDAGAIVALDALDGRFEWAITYESRVDETAASLSDASKKGLLPPLFANGLLFVAPNDADFAYCIEADSGRVRWQYSYLTNAPQVIPEMQRREQEIGQRRDHQWRYLLGVAPGGAAGRLIASGNSLIAIDIATGQKVWQQYRPAFGRGLLADDQILLPTRTTIDVFSQQTGTLLRTISLKTPDTAQLGGNLTIADGMLIVAQPNRLAAYCQYSQLKEKIERELTLQPASPHLLIRLGELEAAEGNVDAAELAFAQIFQVVGRDDAFYVVARQKISKLRFESGKYAYAEMNVVKARDEWQKSLKVTDDPVRRTELFFSLARAEEALDRPESAVEQLQMILGDDRFASIPQGGLTAGVEAARQVSRIIDQHGRSAYELVESAASKEFDELTRNPTIDGLKKFIQRFPHASVISSARHRLVQLYCGRNDVSEAYTLLDEIRRSSVDDQSWIQSTLDIVALLDAADFDDAASQMCRTLAKWNKTTQVVFAGTDQTLGQFLSDRSRALDDDSARLLLNLERTWQRSLPSEARVVIPVNDSPSANLSSILVCVPPDSSSNLWTWQCLDARTGRIRWEETALSPVQIAGWTPVHLLIGTPSGWQARSAEEGRRIWDQNQFPDSIPEFTLPATETRDGSFCPLLFGVERGIQLFDPNDGRLISRIKPPGRMHPLFVIGHPVRLGVTRQATTIASVSMPPPLENSYQGQFDRSLAAFFQTTKPTRTWLAMTTSPGHPWSIHEISSAGEIWLERPFGVGNRVAGITREQHLVACDLDEKRRGKMNRVNATTTMEADVDSNIVDLLRRPNSSVETLNLDDLSKELFLRAFARQGAELRDRSRSSNDWEFRNFAIGQAPPTAWAQKGELLAASDGSLLKNFNPENGHRNWTVGLADFPIQSPTRQICRLDETVFATSQGLLRGIDIHTGKIRVENYLGDTTPQWQTTVVWTRKNNNDEVGKSSDDRSNVRGNSLLAIWPLEISNSDRPTILLCDTESGKITQRLRVDARPHKIFFDRHANGIVWTETSISGISQADR